MKEVPSAKDPKKTEKVLFFSIKHSLQLLLQNVQFSEGLIRTSQYDGVHFQGPTTGSIFHEICADANKVNRCPIMCMFPLYLTSLDSGNQSR